MQEDQPRERQALVVAGAIVVVVLVAATLLPMLVILFDGNRDPADAVPLMAGPFGLLVLGAVVVGAASAAQSAKRNALAAARTSEQGVRVGIVWIMGLALIVLIALFGVLAYRGVALPQGLVALASSLVGGLIGVLAPRTGPSARETGHAVTADGEGGAPPPGSERPSA